MKALLANALVCKTLINQIEETDQDFAPVLTLASEIADQLKKSEQPAMFVYDKDLERLEIYKRELVQVVRTQFPTEFGGDQEMTARNLKRATTRYHSDTAESGDEMKMKILQQTSRYLQWMEGLYTPEKSQELREKHQISLNQNEYEALLEMREILSEVKIGDKECLVPPPLLWIEAL